MNPRSLAHENDMAMRGGRRVVNVLRYLISTICRVLYRALIRNVAPAAGKRTHGFVLNANLGWEMTTSHDGVVRGLPNPLRMSVYSLNGSMCSLHS